MGGVQWFSSLGTIPGIQVPPLGEADFGAGRLPKTKGPPPAIAVGKSPAWHVAFKTNWNELSPMAVAGAVESALEMPGEAGDYYFVMLSATEALWTHRAEHPWFRFYIERLCRLQIQVLEVKPADLKLGVDFNTTVAFPRLARLLEEDGRLSEAIGVAVLGTTYGETTTRGARLSKKLARNAEPG